MNKKLGMEKDRGLVVLFAVLISSIVLAIAVGVSNISLKEVILSSAAKEAHYSFFAADTGAECALYWDLKEDAFGNNPLSPLACAGNAVNVNSSSAALFDFNLNLAGQYCAAVVVDKAGESGTQTKIESLGYNLPCDNLNHPSVVERAIRVTYPNIE